MTAAGETGIPVPVIPFEPFTVPRTFTAAASAPVVEGVKVNRIVQDELGAIVAPLAQVPPPALAKLVGLAPVIVKYGVARTSLAVPLFVTVKVVAALVVP